MKFLSILCVAIQPKEGWLGDNYLCKGKLRQMHYVRPRVQYAGVFRVDDIGLLKYILRFPKAYSKVPGIVE